MQWEGRTREQGFTLIELLIVILIIAILAAIAIPVFLRQREKGWESQVKSALKNAATAIESYATETGGNFAGVAGADSDLPAGSYQVLLSNGFRKPSDVRVEIATKDGDTQYCVTATHTILASSNVWQKATYNSSAGTPSPNNSDDCP